MKIIINSNNLDEKNKEKLSIEIDTLIKRLSKSMNLLNFDGIIISENYSDVVKKFEQDYNISGHGITNEDYAKGGAIIETIIEYGEKHHYIIIDLNLVIIFAYDYNYIENCFDSFEGDCLTYHDLEKLAICLLHHELAHIDEMNKGGNEIHDLLDAADDIVQELVSNISIKVWQEYYACRLSAKSNYILGDLDTLKSCIDIEKRIISNRKKYNKNKLSLDEFVVDFNKSIEIVFKYCAYFHGYGFRYIEEDRSKNILNGLICIKDTRVKEYFIKVGKILNEAFETFPDWETNQMLLDLNLLIISYMNNFHVFTEATNINELCYSIPVFLEGDLSVAD